jgi:hypothetical protein
MDSLIPIFGVPRKLTVSSGKETAAVPSTAKMAQTIFFPMAIHLLFFPDLEASVRLQKTPSLSADKCRNNVFVFSSSGASQEGPKFALALEAPS